MPMCRLFRSFQDMPILYFTLRVANGMPLLADESVPEILRRAWLRSALCDQWLVGAYRIEPDRVSLFASPARADAIRRAWLSTWQETTTEQINAATRGTGRIWAGCPLPLSVASMDDYLGLRAIMAAGTSEMPTAAAAAFGGCEGMIWQLLPFGEPAPEKFASLGVT